MPRLTEETKDARRQQILDAARTCFERSGFTGTSMADIIAESGLSAGSIYSHFPSKDEILRQTAEATFAESEQILRQAATDGQRVLWPREIARTAAQRILSRPLIRMFLQFWTEAPANPELALLVRGNLERAQRMIAEVLLPWARTQTGAPADEAGSEAAARTLAEHRAQGIMALMHGSFVRIMVQPELDAPEFLEHLLELLPADPEREG